MLKIIQKQPTKEAHDLKLALQEHGLEVVEEFYDGFKTVDLTIPQARLDIEVDGKHHLTDPKQIVRDLARGYYSHKDGIDTIHVPNDMIKKYKSEITNALVEASKIRQKRIHLHVG